MAKGIGNLILQNISGKIGKNLVIKQYADGLLFQHTLIQPVAALPFTEI